MIGMVALFMVLGLVRRRDVRMLAKLVFFGFMVI